MKITLQGILLLPLLFIACNGQSDKTADTVYKLDTLVQSCANLNKFSGNILIAKEGKVIFEKSYGFADRELNIPNSRITKFRIGSLTKQFTAVLIMQLVESGKIDLKAPITKYLDYYRKDFGESISIHHLLTHTSGLPEYSERPDFFPDISKRAYTHEEFIKRICSDSLLSNPGSQYKYSNAGYYILGAIIEEITQKSYADVLQNKILDVAGMKNTGVENSSSFIKDIAKGYNFSLGKYSNADYIDISSTVFSAGGIYSTTDDLLLWDKALFADKLISQKSRSLMLTPYLENYAYGVFVTNFLAPDLNIENHFVSHQGAMNGFRSFMTHIIDEDILIILLCNSFNTDLNTINNAVVAVLYNQPYSLPSDDGNKSVIFYHSPFLNQ
jgi:CubicO group peptidase (beta-lactamase class C family)